MGYHSCVEFFLLIICAMMGTALRKVCVMMKNRQVRQSKEYGERKYGLISNVIYNMRSSKIWDRKLFYFQLLMIFPDVASAYLGVLLPAQLVRGLKEKWDMAALLLTIFLLAL